MSYRDGGGAEPLRFRLAVTEDEESDAGNAERNEVDGGNVIEDLLIASRERDDGGDHSLQSDCDDGRRGTRVQPGNAVKEQSILGHGEVDARGSEHSLAEKSEVEMAMPMAMKVAPRSPSAARITAEAGVLVAANPSAPRTRRHTKVTDI